MPYIATFTLTLNSFPVQAASVSYTTVDGTAIAANGDYTETSGVVTFSTNEKVKSIVIPVATPSSTSESKTFSLSFSNFTNVIVLGSGSVNTPNTNNTPVTAIATIPSGSNVVTAAVSGTLKKTTGFVSVTVSVTSTRYINITALLNKATSSILASNINAVTPTWLTAQGGTLYDTYGNAFVPRSINWYGFEQQFMPQGLQHRPYRTVTVNGVTTEGILDQIKRFGFNSIRMLVCEDITFPGATPSNAGVTGGMEPSYSDPLLNPDFFTTPGVYNNQPFIPSLQIMDLLVAYAGSIGLRIILDMHCLAPNFSDVYGDSRNGDPTTKLWYTTTNRLSGGATAGLMNEYRDETQWLAAWVVFANRYRNNPTVMGFDLINEPAGGTWDTDPTANINTNLASAYERAAAAIQDPTKGNNPNALIICEGPATGTVNFYGIQTTNGLEDLQAGTGYSANLTNVINRQVGKQIGSYGTNIASLAGKVVYSPHEYGSSLNGESYNYLQPEQQVAWGSPGAKGYGHQWFYDPTFPDNMPSIWRTQWGYIAEQGIAPVWIGESGADLLLGSNGSTANQIAADEIWLTALNQYIRATNIGLSVWALNPAGSPRGYLYNTTDGVNVDSTNTGNNNEWSFSGNPEQAPYYTALAQPNNTTVTQYYLTYLTTNGNKIYDANGVQFIPRGINYYGTEANLVIQGVEHRAYKTITVGGVVQVGLLDEIAALGFNMIRIQICEDLTWPNRKPISDSSNPLSIYIDPNLNPDFINTNGSYKTAIQMMDFVVQHCRSLGLRIIFDMHCLAPNSSNAAGTTANGKTLWYTTVNPGDAGGTTGVTGEPRNETQIIAAWVFLADHYRNQPTVCGFDLINEPSSGTWDTNPTANLATNLPSFYERCGNAIQAVNPNLLIICEGQSGPTLSFPPVAATGESQSYGTQASANLTNVINRHVNLTIPNKVVYSPHEYASCQFFDLYQYTPASFQGTGKDTGLGFQWFYDPAFPANMPTIWGFQWGYIAEQNIAPVWVGEIGSNFIVAAAHDSTPAYTNANLVCDTAWLSAFNTYARAHNIGFSWWCYNPAGNPIGLLDADSNFVWSVQAHSYQMSHITPLLTP